MSNDHYVCNPYNVSVPVNICSRQKIEKSPFISNWCDNSLETEMFARSFPEFIVLKQGHRMPAEKKLILERSESMTWFMLSKTYFM